MTHHIIYKTTEGNPRDFVFETYCTGDSQNCDGDCSNCIKLKTIICNNNDMFDFVSEALSLLKKEGRLIDKNVY